MSDSCNEPDTEIRYSSPCREFWHQQSDFNKPMNFSLYGGSSAVNVFEYYSGQLGAYTNVLFLDSGDLRNALLTASKAPIGKLVNLHLCDSCPMVTARNALISHIMISDHFNPEKEEDMLYLWDLWYSYEWEETTWTKFNRDLLWLMEQERGTETVSFSDKATLELVVESFQKWQEAANVEPYMIGNTYHLRQKHMAQSAIMDKMADRAPKLGKAPVDLPSEDGNVAEWMSVINRRIMERIHAGNLGSSAAINRDLYFYLWFGNCSGFPRHKPAYLNVTLLTEVMGKKHLLFDYLSTPFDAYFPMAREDRMDFDRECLAFFYCLDQLKKMIVDFRSRKENISFTFSTGPYYSLVCEDSFNIIHSFDTAERVGLANILPAVNRLLVQNDVNAVAVTEIPSKRRNHLPTIANFVEASLHCPISMIPTMYGLRLVNHLDLGSPVPIKFHDHCSVGSIKLQWSRAPSFSPNIKLGFSVDIIRAIYHLAKSCFIPSFYPDTFETPLPYTPLTFFNILRSLVERHVWIRDFMTSHEGGSPFNPVLVPPFYRLAWKTFKDLLMNKSVLIYTASRSFPVQLILKRMQQNPVQLLLVGGDHFKRHDTKPGKVLPPAFFENAHCVDDVRRAVKEPQYTAMTMDEWKVPQFSLFLAKDHGLDKATRLCIVDIKTSAMVFSLDFFTHFSYMDSTPPSAELSKPKVSEVKAPKKGLVVLCCLELADRYEMDLVVRGVSITNGKDVAVTTDRKYPSVSGHRVSLSLGPKTKPLELQFPWPVLSDAINKSYFEVEKHKVIHLVLTKSLADPWPIVFHGNRCKWNFEALPEWRNTAHNGELETHINAQFDCSRLIFQYDPSMAETCVISALDDVRKTIGFILSIAQRNPNYCVYSICSPGCKENPSPAFQLRVHPPIRLSPAGVPLLQVSVLDLQLACQMEEQGKLSCEKLEEDARHIFINAVQDYDETVSFETTAAETVDLLRYLLRLNSSQMEADPWQVANLPLGHDSPWMASFLSPLYSELVLDCCDKFRLVFERMQQKQQEKQQQQLDKPSGISERHCAACLVPDGIDVTLKNCGKCKSIFYCSAECQKQHWGTHKPTCLKLRKLSTISYSDC